MYALAVILALHDRPCAHKVLALHDRRDSVRVMAQGNQ